MSALVRGLAGHDLVLLPELWPAGGYTSLVLGPDGRLLSAYRKIHRYGFGAGERRLMESGQDVAAVDVAVPSGERFTAGLSTCYDLRFPELYRRQVDAGATVLLVPAAWPAARVANWELFTRARAVEDQCLLLGANTAGTHARTPMGGRSRVVLPSGELAAVAGASGEQVLSVDVDLRVIAETRERFPVLRDRRLF